MKLGWSTINSLNTANGRATRKAIKMVLPVILAPVDRVMAIRSSTIPNIRPTTKNSTNLIMFFLFILIFILYLNYTIKAINL